PRHVYPAAANVHRQSTRLVRGDSRSACRLSSLDPSCALKGRAAGRGLANGYHMAGEMRSARYRDIDGSFELSLPVSWEAERDGEGGLLLFASEGHGLLHLMPFERDVDDDADPAEELYAFLAD